jgi:hypothetical protein
MIVMRDLLTDATLCAFIILLLILWAAGERVRNWWE